MCLEVKMKHWAAGFGVLLAVAAAQIFIANRCDHQTRALVMRAQFIMFIQSVMFSFSYISYRYLRDMPKYVSLLFKQTNSQRQILQTIEARNLESYISMSSPKSRWRYALITYFCMCHISYLTNLYLIGTEPHWFAMTAYACLGSFIQLNIALVIFRLLFCLLKKAGLNFSLFGTSVPSNKEYTKSIIILLAFIQAILASTCGLYVAAQPPAVKHVEIPVQDLPRNIHGLSIVQLSDIHLGPTVGYSKLKMIVDIVEKENPGNV